MMLNETEYTMSNTTFHPAFTSDPTLDIIEQRLHECKDLLSKTTSVFAAGNELQTENFFNHFVNECQLQ